MFIPIHLDEHPVKHADGGHGVNSANKNTSLPVQLNRMVVSSLALGERVGVRVAAELGPPNLCQIRLKAPCSKRKQLFYL